MEAADIPMVQPSFIDMSRDELLAYVLGQVEPGIHISFSGKDSARRIARRVQPRVSRHVSGLSVGPPELQARNQIIEGENLQAMVTLYKERGQVDLIITDPPYNTGRDFRYNDKWEEDPNDPGIGEFVSEEDGSKHTKWMRFMYPRLQMMKSMLKPSGVLAICIDHRELFHLGQMLDETELFRTENRLAIINWQRSYTPRNDSRHVAFTTEYILVYARDAGSARTRLLPRAATDTSKRVPDHDPRPWTDSPATGPNAKVHKAMVYGIQSPFTGEIFYPPTGSAWRNEQRRNLEQLRGWGCQFALEDLKDEARRAELIGIPVDDVPKVKGIVLGESLADASSKARAIYKAGPWPSFYFLKGGEGRPRLKKYLDQLKQGFVATTYWADEDYEEPIQLGPVSWEHKQSGHSEEAVDELTAIVGPGHDFKTAKPTKLFKKIIQLWCPSEGLVLDPFAGSGTSGQAVMDLNVESGANRRFILIEQGRPERGDSYARSLTVNRLRRVVTGDWASGERDPINSGFRFLQLQKRVDAKALLSMERDEMTDAVIASHFDANRRGGPGLVMMPGGGFNYLVARNSEREGFFLVWDGRKEPPVFKAEVYDAVVAEAKKAKLRPLYHVYARFNLFQSDDVRFYQIPDRILMDFGLTANEPYNAE